MNPSARVSRVLGTVVFAIAALVSTACFAEPELVPVRMANLNIGLASMPQALAIEKGVFARHGLDLQVINFIKGGAEASAGVASGQVDMGVFGTPVLTAISFGLKIRIVGSPPLKRNNFELVARKGIASVKELKGKVVTCGALGGGNHQALLKILKTNGLGPDDVSVIATGGTDAEMILRSGKVDAVITTEATRIKLEDEGVGTLIAAASDYFGRYQHSYVFATDKFIADHPEAIRAYLAATRDSLDYAKAHEDELIEYSAKRVRMKKELIRAYFDEQFRRWDPGFEVDVEGTANAVEVLKEFKEIKPTASFDPKTWLDLRFL